MAGVVLRQTRIIKNRAPVPPTFSDARRQRYTALNAVRGIPILVHVYSTAVLRERRPLPFS